MKELLLRTMIVFIIIFAFYFATALVLYIFQKNFIYHPNKYKADISSIQEKIENISEVTYQLPNGKQVYAWYLAPKKNKKLIVFFHGNSNNLEKNSNQLTFFAKLGYGFLLPEYEGFGGIPGELSQSELEQDAKTALLWALSKGYKEKDIIIYGHSLGTYVATSAAVFMAKEKQPVAALVLEAPFYSLTNMAKYMFGPIFPFDVLIKDKFETHNLIKQVQTPLFIGHGKNDPVIPYAQGIKLYEQANHPKVFFSSETADHHSLPQMGFIDAVLNIKQ